MRIVVFGLGYVGLTAAGCLAKQGHEIVGIDISETKVSQVNAGICPIGEPGLADLIAQGITAKRLRASQAPGSSLQNADLAIVCVGTPSAPDGSHDMSYIVEVSRQIAVASSDRNTATPLTVAYRSTMRPGSIDEIIAPIFKSSLGEQFSDVVELVYNPEFLREATAVDDFFAPPKIVVGTATGGRSSSMDQLNEGIPAPTFYMGYREAEITKFVDNAWHAVKVSFANEIGRLCVTNEIDPTVIHEVFVADRKLNVSPYYLRPGGAFGGSCLPKDVRALQYLSAHTGSNTPLLDSVIRSNEAHKHFVFEHSTREIPIGGRVLLVGLAFKANSDDLRESPNVDLAMRLLRAGYDLSVFDPDLDPARLVGRNLGYAYAHLPEMGHILISADVAETEAFDLVIDANGRAGNIRLAGHPRIVNLHRLERMATRRRTSGFIQVE